MRNLLWLLRGRPKWKRAHSIVRVVRALEDLRDAKDPRFDQMFALVAFGMGDNRGAQSVVLFTRREE